MGIAPDIDRASTLITSLLDRGYEQQTGAVIRAIVGTSTSGLLERRLQELETEAARLAQQGQRLDANNPVVRALLADFEDAMRANGTLINSIAGDVQLTGANAAGQIVRQLSLPGFSDADLGRIGIRWNVPNPDAIASVVDMVTSPAFEEKLALYIDGTVAQVQGVIINGIASGKGPLAIARAVRQAVQGLPAHNANQLLRTLQLTSYRNASVVHRVANAHILEYQIRIAILDDRTCMSCIALHGTELPIEARVDDHHLGRCDSVTKVRGLARPDVETGEEWFNRQPTNRQQELMGGAMFNAWQAGAITLQDIPREYDDPVFGRMIAENSLRGILGAAAEDYYQRNQ